MSLFGNQGYTAKPQPDERQYDATPASPEMVDEASKVEDKENPPCEPPEEKELPEELKELRDKVFEALPGMLPKVLKMLNAPVAFNSPWNLGAKLLYDAYLIESEGKSQEEKLKLMKALGNKLLKAGGTE